MNHETIDQDLDQFVSDMFHGFSTISIASSKDEKQIQVTLAIMKGLDDVFKKNKVDKGGLEIFSQLILDYTEGKLDEQGKLAFHHLILVLRGLGIVVHNNDSITNLKMEKINAEQKNLRLQKENDLLKEEMVSLRSLLYSKKTQFEAVR